MYVFSTGVTAVVCAGFPSGLECGISVLFGSDVNVVLSCAQVSALYPVLVDVREKGSRGGCCMSVEARLVR